MLNPAIPQRRATDHSRPQRATRALPRDRFTLVMPGQSDHMRGWVAFGLSQPLPEGANAEFRAGYAEHRDCAIDILTAQEDLALLEQGLPRRYSVRFAPAAQATPTPRPFEWVEGWPFLLTLAAVLAVVAALQVSP